MQDNKEVALVGYSGHGYVVAEAAQSIGLTVVGYCDKAVHAQNPFHLPYLGDEAAADFLWRPKTSYLLGIGNNVIRHNVGELVRSKGQNLITVVHTKAVVSRYATLGEGSVVNNSANINALATLGKYCIVNTGAIVEHECILGDAVHIAPGAVLAGAVTVGDFSFVGANAVVKQGVRIGKHCVIGAGAVVLEDVKDHCTVVGNPAKKIK